jgi:hypothetical protein
MRLATAIRMGSLATEIPVRGDVETCAIGMACRAVGKWQPRSVKATLPYIDEEVAMNYATLLAQWPWLNNVRVGCRFCGESLSREYTVFHLFDWHVVDGEITIEQMCDFIDSIDPTPRLVDSQESVETPHEINSEKVTA